MKPLVRWTAQAALYALFAGGIALFSSWPPYRPLAPGQALVKVSFVHLGQRLAECRERSAEELAKLPPNMRARMECGRERSPVTIEVELDGVTVMRHGATPSGLARDGASVVYRRFAVPAGEHRIAVRLKDDARAAGFTHEHSATVRLEPAQVLVIDFDAEHGRITLT